MNKKIFLGLVTSALFLSCDDDDLNLVGDAEIPTDLIENENKAITLQLLHYADVDGNEETALSTVDEFSALVNGFSNDTEYGANTLFVSSGDIIISGPRFYAAEDSSIRAITGSNEPGHIDIAFANYMGVTACALGNHELDAGPSEFAGAISSESDDVTFPGSTFPYLSSNVDFSGESDFIIGNDGDDASTMGTQVASYTTTTIDGETIGIIGAVTPELSSISNTGSLIINGQGSTSILASIIQESVDALKSNGINKIILLAHMQQISIEKELAEALDGVDIIVAGGSNTRMGDSNDTLFEGDPSFDETYPYQATDISGNPTLVVNVDGDFKYLGRLVVDFNEEGIIDIDSLDETVNGSYASSTANVSAIGGIPNTEVVTLQNAVNAVIEEQFNNVIGYSSVYLDGRRSQVRTQETNLGNLSADANLWYANLLSDEVVDISLKNGGGIRTEIGSAVLPAGSNDVNDIVFSAPNNNAVSEGHLKAVLRFDNGLVRLTVTAAELKDIMEHTVSATTDGATPGQFPQIAGFTFTYSENGTARTEVGTGSRIISLQVGNDDVVSNGEIIGDPTRTFNMVTLNFLANDSGDGLGGDSYPLTEAALSASNRTNFYEGAGFGEDFDYPDATLANDPNLNTSFSYTGGEQDALAEFMLFQYPSFDNSYNIEETAVENDTRIIKMN